MIEAQTQVEASQAQVEQEALDTLARSRETTQEQVTGQSETTPEGYNDDGTPVVDTPELIGGKFNTQEDLLNAYQELERKMSQAPKVEEPVVKAEEETTTDGINIAKYDTEFRDTGTISEDSYKELEGKGFSKGDVDRYIAGQQALVTNFTNDIYSKVGGEEVYTELVTWASENIPQATIDEYNTSLSEGKTEKTIQLLEYMNFKRGNGEVASKTTRITPTAKNGGQGMKAFSDKGEWQRATADRLYGKDAKYTNMIDKRFLASKKQGTI